MQFEGVTTATQAEGWRGVAAAGRAARRASRRRRALGPRAGRAPTVVLADGTDGRRRSPRSRPTRRATCSCSTAARSCRWCSSSTQAPGRVTIDPPDGPVRPRRPTLGAAMRIDVFTIFPDMVADFAGAEPARQGPGSGHARPAGARPAGRDHRLRTARSTTRRSAAAPGMVLMPEPVFAAVEAVDPPRPLLLPRPGRPPPRPGVAARAGRAATASPCCAAATRASTSGCASTSSTASCRSATTCSAAARWPRWSCSRPSAGWCPGVMGNDASADDESFSDGLLEYPQYTRPGRVPGLGRARGAALRRPRRASPAGGGPRRWPARARDRPDLIEARGGLSRRRAALLAEFDL